MSSYAVTGSTGSTGPSAPTAVGTPSTGQTITVGEVLFMMSCYCYISAHNIGYNALSELNPNFVVVNDLSGSAVAEAESQITASEELADSTEARVPVVEDLFSS